ncbi:AMP-binding protein [Frankia gtarii]|uniref:AMP-binding protein n=1 Tax=Frankia gtarii TaxID=2950102 RepID=UPI0021BE6B1E|nr:AMP-binding protein [Frankia gtarii]
MTGPRGRRDQGANVRDRTLYQWFASTADRHPDAVALEVAGDRLSYVELRARAEAVARLLVAGRQRPPVRVALVAARTVAAYVGYLAIQRVGASVLPLNPEHPAPRNLDIAQRAEVEAAIVAEDLSDPFLDLPRRFRPQLVTLAADGTASGSRPVGAEPAAEVALPPEPSNLDAEACVLFTSGTTGVPKGVPLRHRNISPYITHNITRFEVGPGCRLSQVFAFTVDAAMGDLFMAWGSGATLVVPSREDLYRPVDFIVDNGLTHWFAVPSVARVAENLGNLPTGRATTLRHSLFGAEPVTAKHMRAWRAVAPRTALHNLYGPTETTINCTEFSLAADAQADSWPVASNGTVPIGVMYPGMEALVIDVAGRPCDDGELCLRGPQRFDGYLDPAENEGRFVVWDGEKAAQLHTGDEPPGPQLWYRTGDRVTRENGNLVHHGRLDQQVKIMGSRVEIGEVEAAMHRHPHVTDAAVVAVTDGDATRLLGAYAGSRVEPADFDHWLRRELPLQMVPARIVHLPALPLNDNGKVDRPRLADLLVAATAPAPVSSGLAVRP